MTPGEEVDVYLALAPNVHVEFAEARIMVVSENEALEIGGDVQAAAKVLSALREGVRASALTARGDARQVYAVLAELACRRWLVTERLDIVSGDQFQQVRRWLASVTSRPVAALEALRRAGVAIVGAGGLGAEVAQHLAGAGVGALWLIDGDVVEAENLNRQFLYDHQSLGQPKAEAAAARLRARSPDLHVTALRGFLMTPSDLDTLDDAGFGLLVNCADEPAGLDQMLAAYCARRELPFVMAGVGLHRGYWGPFLTSSVDQGLSRFQVQLAAAQGDFAAAWDRSWVCTASHSPYNSIVAAHLASDVILYLSGAQSPQSLGRRLYIDFGRLSVTAVGDVDPIAAAAAVPATVG